MKQVAGRLFIAFISLSAILLFSCKTSTIAVNRAELKNVKTIAVMKFEVASEVTKEVGKECEESFRGNFVNAGFNVVEREKLKSILKETEMTQTGITSDSIQIGKLLGAEALLFGEVTKNNSEVKWVNYNEYIKDPATGKTVRVEKTKQKKFFTFQIHIRLVSTQTGNTILTLKNTYPERDYELTSSTTLEKFREGILSQMGDDLKEEVEKK